MSTVVMYLIRNSSIRNNTEISQKNEKHIHSSGTYFFSKQLHIFRLSLELLSFERNVCPKIYLKRRYFRVKS